MKLSKDEFLEKKKSLVQQADEFIVKLAEEVDATKGSEMFLRFLSLLAQFHRYSVRNLLLIYGQYPNAYRIASKTTWWKLGRKIKKEAWPHKIWILRPLTKIVENYSGKIEVFLRRYAVCYVFDIAQTETVPGKEDKASKLLTPGGFIQGEVDSRVWDILIEMARKQGIRTHLSKGLGIGVTGTCTPTDIYIRAELSWAQRIQTFFHEWAHLQLHWPEVPAGASAKSYLNLQDIELEAESVAAACAESLGIKSVQVSTTYLLLYKGNSEKLKRSMNRIAGCVKDTLEYLYKELGVSDLEPDGESEGEPESEVGSMKPTAPAIEELTPENVWEWI